MPQAMLCTQVLGRREVCDSHPHIQSISFRLPQTLTPKFIIKPSPLPWFRIYQSHLEHRDKLSFFHFPAHLPQDARVIIPT